MANCPVSRRWGVQEHGTLSAELGHSRMVGACQIQPPGADRGGDTHETMGGAV